MRRVVPTWPAKITPVRNSSRPLIHVPDVDANAGLVEFGLDRAEVGRMWHYMLAMAMRDLATSLHWHPWLGGDALCYIVKRKRYFLIRPPAELDPLVSAVARELIAPGRIRSTIGLWLGRPVAGQFTCINARGPAEWCGVWWSAGDKTGVDFFRTDTPPTPITVGTAPDGWENDSRNQPLKEKG